VSAIAPAATRPDYRVGPHRRRKIVNQIALTLSLFAMAFGLVWLIWILWDTLILGAKGLTAATFTESTPPPNAEGGGLANAIMGSLIMVTAATGVGTPIGILAGIYLAEYGQRTWLGHITRFINDILLSAPSIVIGLFVYAIIVAKARTFSGYAGVIALALIVIPVVVRTTENMQQRAGVVTGVLLALARIAGETAPLLFTALSNQFFSLNLGQPMANLPVTIFKFAMSPFSNWQQMAWAGVFLITVGVLALNILARVLFRQKH
jgi:phosphate transport system permease protein